MTFFQVQVVISLGAMTLFLWRAVVYLERAVVALEAQAEAQGALADADLAQAEAQALRTLESLGAADKAEREAMESNWAAVCASCGQWTNLCKCPQGDASFRAERATKLSSG